MQFSGWFSLIVGLMMLAQWIFFLAAGQVPEVTTAPVALGFHLVAEAATAVTLIAAGVGLLQSKAWARTLHLFALGMLTYTVIVSPGYFAQQGSWPLVVMFAVLLVLALFSMRKTVQPQG